MEKVDIEEGEEITVTIKEIPVSSDKKSAFKRSAGSWKGTIDADKLIKDI